MGIEDDEGEEQVVVPLKLEFGQPEKEQKQRQPLRPLMGTTSVQVPEPAAAGEYAAPSGAEPQWQVAVEVAAEGGGSGSTVLLLLGAGALLLGLRRCCGGLQPAKQSAH